MMAKKIAAAPGARATAESGAEIAPTDMTIVRIEVITLSLLAQLRDAGRYTPPWEILHKQYFYIYYSLRPIQLSGPPEAESRSAARGRLD
jgi:hypothetical protein